MAETESPRPTSPAIVARPANEVPWADLDLIMGVRGGAARCRCQRYKLAPGESFASNPTAERAERLRSQAHLDGEPVGWCAVEPGPAYPGLVHNNRVPWRGRAEGRGDDRVWAVTCLFTRVGFRHRGISRVLAAAAVGFARERAARALESYPITTTDVLAEERRVGVPSVLAAAGLVEVSRPTPRRAVMRIDFG